MDDLFTLMLFDEKDPPTCVITVGYMRDDDGLVHVVSEMPDISPLGQMRFVIRERAPIADIRQSFLLIEMTIQEEIKSRNAHLIAADRIITRGNK